MSHAHSLAICSAVFGTSRARSDPIGSVNMGGGGGGGGSLESEFKVAVGRRICVPAAAAAN